MEGAAGILRQLDALGGGALHGAFDAIDGRVEVALSHLESGLPGLANLLGDALVLDLEVGVIPGLLADEAGEPVVLTGVGSYVGEDTEES